MLPKSLSTNWDFVPLGELGTYINGMAFKPKDWETVGLPIIRIQNLTDPEAQFNYYSKPVDKRFYVHNGDLLISWSATLGAYIWDRGDAILNQHIFRVQVNESRVEKVFLKYAVQTALGDLEKRTHGATMRHVTKGEFESFRIPLPRSLDIQRRIVARIEALLAEVREMQGLHADIVDHTVNLMPGCIQEVFEPQHSDWVTEQLSQVAVIQTGTAKGRRFGDRPTVELPYLRVANVQAGYLDLSEIKTIPIAADELDRYRLQAGDLLLTEGGDYDKLGRGAVWDGEIEPCIHQNHVFAVRFDQSKVLPRFAEYEMQSEYGKQYFLSVAKKTTNLASINKTQLGAFPLRFPRNMNEQQKIIEYLDTIRDEVKEMQQTQTTDKTLIEQLEQSILAQAFRGEL